MFSELNLGNFYMVKQTHKTLVERGNWGQTTETYQIKLLYLL